MLSGPEYHKQRALSNAETLDQMVADRFALRIGCKSCGRSVIVDPLPLVRLAMLKRWNRSRWAIGKHIRCSDCGSIWPEITPVDQEPNHAPIGIVTEEQFNAMKRRLRG